MANKRPKTGKAKVCVRCGRKVALTHKGTLKHLGGSWKVPPPACAGALLARPRKANKRKTKAAAEVAA